ncbi:MAG: DNA-directed RNA polymerase subunit beta' [Thermoanaerobaculia bacterium]
MSYQILTDKPNSLEDFNAIKISLAPPETIKKWSRGEVTKPETINYRTFKPEKDGLFCAKIFGPVNDWECLCGKYKRMKFKGVTCDKCGVEVTRARVRRERMAHIELATPVSHIWFLKGAPSRIGLILDMTLKDLESVIYYEKYIVVEPGSTDLKEKQILTEDEYKEYQKKYGPDSFLAKMGAEAIRDLLEKIDLDKLAEELRLEMKSTTSKQRQIKASKRLKIVDAFKKSGQRPEWMTITIIPVLPPDLRPLVLLDGGRFASSDLNDLYRRVINRNNRLKKLIDLKAPEIIVRNEKRMLQEAVDALFDNGRRGRAIKGANNRPLKSLSDSLKGKQGRFRQNLLGKRVDYSGRSVIVVGPKLKLHQCGLPKTMALELFKPFLYQKFLEMGLTNTIKGSKELVESNDDIVWDILEKVTKEHPVLLNRAPTLHRLGIQAFEPVLVEGKAIQIHPLVCAAFNADFDGDQMAVHIPLTPKAQLEARLLMLSSYNILSPANGKPLAVPSQDMVLGIYYLTKEMPNSKGEGKVFGSIQEVIHALEAKVVEIGTKIKLRWQGQLIDLEKQIDNQDIVNAPIEEAEDILIDTTVGRAIFNEALLEEMPYINGLLKKKGITSLINFCYLNYGLEKTVQLLDTLKELGFEYSTLSGLTFGLDDLIVPENKEAFIQKAYQEVQKVEKQRAAGAITQGEKHNKIIDIWQNVTDQVAKVMFTKMKESENEGKLNPIFAMVDSGARGSKEQVRQLAGMRGLMSKPSGEVIETPITANFREGLSVLQYFISTHGARKGLADTALKTADSGYLTRRLVDVAQDLMIVEEDCKCLSGIEVGPLEEAGEVLETLRERIIGRVALEEILDPLTGEVLVRPNEMITEKIAGVIQEAGIDRVKIRSVLTCESQKGICQKCYGRDLATGKLVEIGVAIGIIAAQSIGEPGTQLTMRTFHYGGTASGVREQNQNEAHKEGIVKFDKIRTIVNREGKLVAINRNGRLIILDKKNKKKELEYFPITYGSTILVKDGEEVKPGKVLSYWDPYSFIILSEIEGTVVFKDIIEGENVREDIDKITGKAQKVIVESLSQEKRIPQIIVKQGEKEEKRYYLPPHSHLMVQDGQEVYPGDILAKIPTQSIKTKDITGGLPRVQELFEARRPKEPAIVSEINGFVSYGKISKGMREIIVKGDFEERTYLIPKHMHVSVQEGEYVEACDPLTDGHINPHDVLKIKGEKALQMKLVEKIQEVYRSQGVEINDKHIEVIVRQMGRMMKIEDPGDTDFVIGEYVDRNVVQEANQNVQAKGKTPAKARPVLLGITKAALATESFIAAASFQETTRVLNSAAIAGKIDTLRGIKENVIVGRLIPAGTGCPLYREFSLPEEVVKQPEEEPFVSEEELQEEFSSLVKDDTEKEGEEN